MQGDGMQLRAREALTSLSEDDVRKAMDGDTFCDSPVTAEVTRLAAAYTAQLLARERVHGIARSDLMLALRPQCPIERIAALIVVMYFESDRKAH